MKPNDEVQDLNAEMLETLMSARTALVFAKLFALSVKSTATATASNLMLNDCAQAMAEIDAVIAKARGQNSEGKI